MNTNHSELGNLESKFTHVISWGRHPYAHSRSMHIFISVQCHCAKHFAGTLMRKGNGFWVGTTVCLECARSPHVCMCFLQGLWFFLSQRCILQVTGVVYIVPHDWVGVWYALPPKDVLSRVSSHLEPWAPGWAPATRHPDLGQVGWKIILLFVFINPSEVYVWLTCIS